MPGFNSPDDEYLNKWLRGTIKVAENQRVCCLCSGLLQTGSGVVEIIQSSLDDACYQNIFGCLLSVQFPPDLLFRQYIERVVQGDVLCSDVRDVFRGLIQRAVISEQHSEKMPKLFVDVIVQFPESYVGVPIELMQAVNSARKHKFRTVHSVNIADVQQFMESTKGNVSLVYRALFRGLQPENDPGIEEMKFLLQSKFLDVEAVVPSVSVSLRRETVYLVGSYVKDTRDFGQSQWDAHETSVAETICPEICKLFDSPIDKCLFSASGREDMDVRMLGDGRSFVLQLGDAKSLQPLMNDECTLKSFKLDTGEVKVLSGLRWVDKGVMDWLHWSTEQHLKVYRCVVWTEAPLPSQAELDRIHKERINLKILQKTPLRVLHRRTENTREKRMYSVQGERLNDHFAIFTFHASAGAYIKEFVHGDFGRTAPSFAEVVFGSHVRCDILQLDVLEVKQEEEERYVPVWDR